MTSTAARRRPTWSALPRGVRAAIEQRLGARVTGATSHDGGYSPGLASTLMTPDGPVFVKAVAVEHEFSARVYRQEVQRFAVLPAGTPAPQARWALEIDDDGGWVAIAFDAVAGRTPGTPLVGVDLDAVARLALEIGTHRIAPGLLPELIDELPHTHVAGLADARPAGLATYDPWFAANLDALAAIEQDVPDAVRGDALVHGDLRGDNAVLLGEGEGLWAVAVDWPYAGRGCAFVDLVAMLPAVHAGGGPAPEVVLARHPLPQGTEDDAVTAVLVALAGYFVASSLDAPPPGIPHLRAFQRAQGEASVAWLRRRLGS
ncbi:phosphotransferase family protein [Isoptericola jiangsuensis]|uniref:phosphotransferase family protein n=1 Tax=Isoptericola jiangsuensis TaxID=548579 RepID=UPI003AAE2925